MPRVGVTEQVLNLRSLYVQKGGKGYDYELSHSLYLKADILPFPPWNVRVAIVTGGMGGDGWWGVTMEGREGEGVPWSSETFLSVSHAS